MRMRPFGAFVAGVFLVAGVIDAGAGLGAAAEGFTAKVLSSSQPRSVTTMKGLTKTDAIIPAGKGWCVVQVEFTPTAKEATVSLKKMRVLTEDGKNYRPVAFAPPWDEAFGFLDSLAMAPGAVGQLYTLEEGDLFIYQKKGGGQIVLQAKKPVRIKFLFELPAGSTPKELELDEATKLPLQ